MAPDVTGVPLTFQPMGTFSDSDASVTACPPSLVNVAGTMMVWPGFATGMATETWVAGAYSPTALRSGDTRYSTALDAGTDAVIAPADSRVVLAHRFHTA